jgi:hypothetical protein
LGGYAALIKMAMKNLPEEARRIPGGLPENADRDQTEEQRWEAQAGEPVEAHCPLRLAR